MRSLCSSYRRSFFHVPKGGNQHGMQNVEARSTALVQTLDKIRSRVAKVAVLGLGYVGQPLVCALSEAGFSVIGIDVDKDKVNRLAHGETVDLTIEPEMFRSGVRAGRIQITDDPSVIQETDAAIICVPTPLTRYQVPDMSYLERAISMIAASAHEGMVVVLESTTYPGTTDEVLRPAIEAQGLRIGEQIFVAFSPERIDPGNRTFNTKNTPKLVAGITSACTEAAVMLYGSILDRVVPVSSPRVAEMAKIFENTYRAVNIALVNELAILCDRMDMSIWETLDAAGTKPFGLEVFRPGPGVGGHCIPLDPFYLSWKAREHDFRVRFIELAGEINRQMPQYVVEKIARLLNQRGRSVRGSRVCVLGVSYKKDVGDVRESPALEVMALLTRLGAEVVYHDPHVPRLVEPFAGEIRQSLALEEALSGSDCVVITTDHSAVDYEVVVRTSALILDARNATREVVADKSHVTLL